MSLHPRTVVADAALCLGLVAAMLVEMWKDTYQSTLITPLSVGVIVLASLPVLIRRKQPMSALVLGMVTLYVVMAAVDIYQTVPFPTMMAGYAVALAYDRRTTILTGLLLVPFVVAAIAIFGHGTALFTATEVPKNLAFVAAPLLLGSAVRERRAAHAALVDRAETAEQTREEEARRRVGEERLRIARDVHDVVAHAMVAINVQAGVGAHLLDRDPESARRTLEDIKRVSGGALHDLRATIGTLRTDDESEPALVAPTQSLHELGDLSASLRSAGIGVDLDIDPRVASLPVAVTATGYRIVQEALTNVVRHAHGAHAIVRVEQLQGNVVIDVRDDGLGDGLDIGLDARSAGPLGTGNGLRGMRERAMAAGGSLEAGPQAAGGWRVVATLPVGQP